MGGLFDNVKKDTSGIINILPDVILKDDKKKEYELEKNPDYPFDEKGEMTDADAKREIAIAMHEASKVELPADSPLLKKRAVIDGEVVEVANSLFGEEEITGVIVKKPLKKKKSTRKKKKSTAKKTKKTTAKKKKKSTAKKTKKTTAKKKKKSTAKKPPKKIEIKKPPKDEPSKTKVPQFTPNFKTGEIETDYVEIPSGKYVPPEPAPEYKMIQYKVPTLQIAKRMPSEEEILYMVQRHEFVKKMVVNKTDYIDIRSTPYLKKSGWRKFINAFGISIELVSRRTWEEYDDVHAEVIVRAITPNGQSVEGIGIKSMKDIFTDRNLHNLVATAWTRAVNRAVADLVAFGEVSAEEMASGSAGNQSLF